MDQELNKHKEIGGMLWRRGGALGSGGPSSGSDVAEMAGKWAVQQVWGEPGESLHRQLLLVAMVAAPWCVAFPAGGIIVVSSSTMLLVAIR